jgi:hypothetical protein
MAKKKAAKKKAGGARGRKKSPKSKTAKKKSGVRELIAPRGDKRFVRRDDQGQFSESDDVGRSLSSDRRKKAKRAAKPGQGDKGDRKSRST